MEFQEIIQFISTIGFPIVMCLVLFKYIEKQHEGHKEEIGVLNESISNNTTAINDLKLFIQSLSNDVDDIKHEIRKEREANE